MPTWWGRKSSKTKKQQQQEVQPHGVRHFSFIRSNGAAASAAKKANKPDKPNHSFDDILSRNSPRVSRDFSSPAAVAAGAGGSSSGFSCFDSDGAAEKRGLPLPRPSVSSIQSFGNDQGLTFGSASVSGSSVSSTGSFDDHPITPHSQINGTRFVFFNYDSIFSLLFWSFFIFYFFSCSGSVNY